MKKLITAMMALVAIACTIEKPEVTVTTLTEQEITITATNGELDTRTVRAADGSVLWSPGDQISLFYGNGTSGGSCFTSQNTEVAATANFTGTIGVITGGNDVAVEDTYFWATYPYNASASCDGSSITTVLPSSQVAVANTFANNTFPTIGRSQGLNIGFYSICGGLKITISEEGIKSITLQGHNNEVLAGTITVGFDANNLPTVQSITDGSGTITISAPDGETFEVGKAYYLVFVPTVFENGFTLTFDKGYARAVYDRTKSTTIRRSAFGGLTNPDANLEWEMLYVNIPDPNFKAYMIKNFDTNGNGELDFDEAEAVTSIYVTTDNIETLEGIAYCTNLQYLRCGGSAVDKGKLRDLDVSSNTALTYLYCGRNPLTSLDISKNTALTEVWCHMTNITSLDVSHVTALNKLYCYDNPLTSLNLGSLTYLVKVNCERCQLQSLIISGNSRLTELHSNNNQLTSLNVSANTSLTHLHCSNNQLTSLDVSANTSLTHLSCGNNQLTSLNVSLNTELTNLLCHSNLFTSLDVSSNTSLKILSCYDNMLISLDVSMNTALTDLRCDSNQLMTLDVSANTLLQRLYCYNNNLATLDVSANTALTKLWCNDNQFTSLDVSSNTALNDFDCSPMNDAQGNNLLGYLYIAQGQSIPNVTIDRNPDFVPAETIIMVAPEPGGNEGTVDDPLD